MIVITAVICWLYTAFIGMKNGEISIDGCDMGNSIVMFYINAFVGSMACILTFKLVSREYKFIKKIGMTTMTILATHFYVGIPAKVIAVMLLSMSAQNMETWYVVLASLIALALGVLVDGILTKCCPTMIGKNKLK